MPTNDYEQAARELLQPLKEYSISIAFERELDIATAAILELVDRGIHDETIRINKIFGDDRTRRSQELHHCCNAPLNGAHAKYCYNSQTGRAE